MGFDARVVKYVYDSAYQLLAWNGEVRLSSLTQPIGGEERYAYDPR
jgi:hypothetical protein